MKIIKSGGIEAIFNKNNIIRAIQAANQRVGLDKRFTNNEITKDDFSELKLYIESHPISLEYTTSPSLVLISIFLK